MLKLKKKQLRKVNWLVREVIGSGVGSKLKGGGLDLSNIKLNNKPQCLFLPHSCVQQLSAICQTLDFDLFDVRSKSTCFYSLSLSFFFACIRVSI